MTTHKQIHERSPRRMVLLIIIGLALLAAAILLMNRPGIAPQLVVEPERIDLGALPLGEPASFEFQLTNAGSGALRFKEKPYVEILEGCWPPDLTIGSMVLEPGESTTLRSNSYTMPDGMGGPHNFAIHLVTNDAGTPDRVVNVLTLWGP